MQYVEIAAPTRKQFRDWPWDKREEYLKKHPDSEFQWHNILAEKKIRLGETPKLGNNWKEHLYHADPEHHRRHAKAHTIAHAHIMAQTKTAVGKEKERLLKEAAKRKKWADNHMKVYHALAKHYLK
jgi:hypothetical protein